MAGTGIYTSGVCKKRQKPLCCSLRRVELGAVKGLGRDLVHLRRPLVSKRGAQPVPAWGAFRAGMGTSEAARLAFRSLGLDEWLGQGCQTHFHRGPHQPHGCLQRAEWNFRTV